MKKFSVAKILIASCLMLQASHVTAMPTFSCGPALAKLRTNILRDDDSDGIRNSLIDVMISESTLLSSEIYKKIVASAKYTDALSLPIKPPNEKANANKVYLRHEVAEVPLDYTQEHYLNELVNDFYNRNQDQAMRNWYFATQNHLTTPQIKDLTGISPEDILGLKTMSASAHASRLVSRIATVDKETAQHFQSLAPSQRIKDLPLSLRLKHATSVWNSMLAWAREPFVTDTSVQPPKLADPENLDLNQVTKVTKVAEADGLKYEDFMDLFQILQLIDENPEFRRETINIIERTMDHILDVEAPTSPKAKKAITAVAATAPEAEKYHRWIVRKFDANSQIALLHRESLLGERAFEEAIPLRDLMTNHTGLLFSPTFFKVYRLETQHISKDVNALGPLIRNMSLKARKEISLKIWDRLRDIYGISHAGENILYIRRKANLLHISTDTYLKRSFLVSAIEMDPAFKAAVLESIKNSLADCAIISNETLTAETLVKDMGKMSAKTFFGVNQHRYVSAYGKINKFLQLAQDRAFENGDPEGE